MLHRFDLQGFRNYGAESFYPQAGLNLVVGPNGSGKTSLLEAIHVLATGRSFRQTRGSGLIAEGSSEAVLFAEVGGSDRRHRIGMRRRGSGIRSLRLDGENAGSMGEVARVFPVQVFHPGTADLVVGGPGVRRRYLDWGLFHVEPSFAATHREFRQALDQRNRLLKKGRLDARELGVWDGQIVAASDRIDQLRRDWLARLSPVVNRLLAELAPLPSVALKLDSGWPEDRSLARLFQEERDRDIARGFTGRGAHRADLRLTTDAGSVRDVFSRGQTKSLAYVLVLAQLELLVAEVGRSCLVLVDDLGSELDADHRNGVLQMIQRLGQQTIFTALAADEDLLAPLDRDIRMFHVEHGKLKTG
jgi:DNA replication and repair protein RecF